MFTTETLPKNSQPNHWWMNQKQRLFSTATEPAAPSTEPPVIYLDQQPKRNLPERLSGWAVPWQTTSSVVFTSTTGIQFRDRFEPGAFNRSLAAIAAGRLAVPLLWEHQEQGRVFLWMHDRGVSLRDAHGGLFLAIATRAQDSLVGAALADFIRGIPSACCLSAGYLARDYTYSGTGAVKTRTITDADLLEISLAKTAGMGSAARLEFNNSTIDL